MKRTYLSTIAITICYFCLISCTLHARETSMRSIDQQSSQTLSAREFFQVDIEQARKAMRDEIRRSLAELNIESLQKPYYIEYTLTFKAAYALKATLGTITERTYSVSPRLNVGIRVGSPGFDNTNYFDVGLSFFGSSDDEEQFRNRRVTAETDYIQLRRDLWLSTDAAFKQALELYAKKESSLKNRSRTDTTTDFVLLPPATVVDTFGIPTFDELYWRTTLERASAPLAKYPLVMASSIGVEYLPELTIYVNSEGREYIRTELQTGVESVLSTQAADGMPLANTFTAYSQAPSGLVNADSIIRGVERVAQELSAIVASPTIESYSGPVLFEQQAAAEIFAQGFAPYLVAQRSPITERGMQDNERFSALQNKIGARVMADFLTVTSSPQSKSIGTTPVFGTFAIDDDGIVPAPMTMVANGYLKALATSRTPTKKIRSSNGRQRGGAPMVDVYILSAAKRKQATTSELRKRMKKILEQRDLPYGYVVRKVLNQNILYTTLYSQTSGDYPYSFGESVVNLLEVYRVYQNGREELVRGVQAAGMSPSAFKDVVATGTASYTYNYLAPAVISPYITGGSQYIPCTVSVPDLLFEDIELRPLESDFPKPPLMKSPLSEK